MMCVFRAKAVRSEGTKGGEESHGEALKGLPELKC